MFNIKTVSDTTVLDVIMKKIAKEYEKFGETYNPIVYEIQERFSKFHGKKWDYFKKDKTCFLDWEELIKRARVIDS